MPQRVLGPQLNYASLTAQPPDDYLIGPGDQLDVTVPELFPEAEIQPMRVHVTADGTIQLPLLEPLPVLGMDLAQVQRAITAAYRDGQILRSPRVSVSLAVPRTIEVLVLGEVNEPGIKPLPKYQNDIGHALAAAGGLNELAGDVIEVHRRVRGPSTVPEQLVCYDEDVNDPKSVLRIPLRGFPGALLSQEDVVLAPGDVVVVPDRKHEVFFVVGQLDESNLVRFTLGNRERELGSGLILPRDREIDVVTAVVMAGYIDPIDSPTTATVHRVMPDGSPLLITVDLIAARYDPRWTVLVQPGDIIYINPDAPWWMRRTFDRIVPDLILFPYGDIISRGILGPRRGN